MATEDPDGTQLKFAARAQRKAGKLLDSLRSYDRLIVLGLADREVWREVGQTLNQVGEFAQALDAFERSCKLGPADAETLHDHGLALYELGEVDQAAAQLQAAAELTDHPNT